jgi:hypothetical protein
LLYLLASLQARNVVSGGSHISTEEACIHSLWKEIDTEENYEHSVVKRPNIITEPAVRRIELNL